MQAADLLIARPAMQAGPLDSQRREPYLRVIPFHRLPAALRCVRRFSVGQVHRFEMGRACHAALWS